MQSTDRKQLQNKNCMPCKIIFHKQEGNNFYTIKLRQFTTNKFSLMEFPKGVFQREGRNLQKETQSYRGKWQMNTVINILLSLFKIESIKQ